MNVSIGGINHAMKVYRVTILSVLPSRTRKCLILQTSLNKCLYLIVNQIVKIANQIYKNVPPFFNMAANFKFSYENPCILWFFGLI